MSVFFRRLVGQEVGLPVALVASLYTVVASITGMTLLSKAHLLVAVTHKPQILPVAYAGIAVMAVLPFFYKWLLRWSALLSPAAIVGMAVCTGVVQPKVAALLHGSMMGGLWPYDSASMWSHDPMSCGPGWVALHIPFLSVLSYPLTMLTILLLCFGLLVLSAGLTETKRFVTLVALVPGFWLSLVDGNDFGTFAVILVVLVAAVQSYGANAAIIALSTVIAVLVSQFRLPFLLLPLVILFGIGGKVRLSLIATVLSIAIWFIFYWIEPVRFVTEGPMHIVGKLSGLMHIQVLFGLMMAGIAVGMVLVYGVAAKFRLVDSVMIYVAAIVLPASALDFVGKYQSLGGFTDALQFWEGEAWLTAVACVAAWGLAHRFPTRVLKAPPNSAPRPAVKAGT